MCAYIIVQISKYESMWGNSHAAALSPSFIPSTLHCPQEKEGRRKGGKGRKFPPLLLWCVPAVSGEWKVFTGCCPSGQRKASRGLFTLLPAVGLPREIPAGKSVLVHGLLTLSSPTWASVLSAQRDHTCSYGSTFTLKGDSLTENIELVSGYFT